MPICSECKNKYSVDLLLPDRLWKQIASIGVEQNLCGGCIMEKLETLGHTEIKICDCGFEKGN